MPLKVLNKVKKVCTGCQKGYLAQKESSKYCSKPCMFKHRRDIGYTWGFYGDVA